MSSLRYGWCTHASIFFDRRNRLIFRARDTLIRGVLRKGPEASRFSENESIFPSWFGHISLYYITDSIK